MRKMNSVDHDRLHELYMAGKKADEIALVLGTTTGYINNLIQRLRKSEPLKWPRRKGSAAYIEAEQASPPVEKPPLEATYKRELSTTPANGEVIKRQMTSEEREKYSALQPPTNSLGNPIKQSFHIPERK